MLIAAILTAKIYPKYNKSNLNTNFKIRILQLFSIFTTYEKQNKFKFNWQNSVINCINSAID